MPAAKPASPTLQRGKPLSDLAAGWPMHEGAGPKAYDLSGKDNHASLSASGASWAGGGSGWCVKLDGSAGYVSLPYAAFSPLKRLTVALWVNPSTASLPGDVRYWCFGSNLMSLGTAFGVLGGLSARIQIGGSGTQTFVSSGSGVSAGSWTHLALTYDGATLAAWSNAQLVTSTAASGDLDWTSFSDGVVTLGAQDAGSDFFPGLIDGPVVYGRALSQPELAALAADSWRMYRRRSWRLRVAGGTAFSRTASDSPATTDSASRVFTGTRTASDSPATTDSPARTVTLARTASDSPATTDSPARALTLGRTASDSPHTTDSVARVLTAVRATADAPATADAVTRLGTFRRTTADSPATTDSVFATKAKLVSAADSPATTDSLARVLAAARAAADAPQTADSVARTGAFFRVLSDSPLTTEAVTASGRTVLPVPALLCWSEPARGVTWSEDARPATWGA